MLTNLTVSVVEQFKGTCAYEMKQDKENDGDEKSKAEKDFEKELEKEMEKKSLSFSLPYTLWEIGKFDLLEIQTAIIIKNEKFISELFTSLPELPPELV